LYKMQLEMDENYQKFREECEKAKEDCFIAKNKLLEKENIIAQLRRECEKHVVATNNVNSSNNTNNTSTQAQNRQIQRKELYITDPNKINIEMNNEISATRDILAKLSKLLNVEKLRNEKLDAKVNQLEEELTALKTQGIVIKENKLTENIPQDEGEGEIIKTEDLESDEDIGVTDSKRTEHHSVIFPDKVKSPLNRSINNKSSLNLVPKLDFSLVNAKYQSETMKKVKIMDHKKLDKNLTKLEEELTNQIEKLKNDLKKTNQISESLQNKVEKYKKAYEDIKKKYSKEKENYKALNLKVEFLEIQLKKYFTPQASTDDLSYKQMEHNTSMVSFLIKVA
jgi:hypothetical protein